MSHLLLHLFSVYNSCHGIGASLHKPPQRAATEPSWSSRDERQACIRLFDRAAEV